MKEQLEGLNHANMKLKVREDNASKNLLDKEKFLENMDKAFKIKLGVQEKKFKEVIHKLKMEMHVLKMHKEDVWSEAAKSF